MSAVPSPADDCHSNALLLDVVLRRLHYGGTFGRRSAAMPEMQAERNFAVNVDGRYTIEGGIEKLAGV
jgi:hypothetical protein